MNRAAWWSCALLALSVVGSQARIYQRCELARDLRALGVHPDHISTWVCIAYHESRFDTAANNPHSGDHGIFQISELYWCGAGKVCGLPCAALRDDDIADDLECALQVHEEHTRLQGDGFLAWVVYPQHCKQPTKKYLIDCDENLKNASSLAPSEGRAFSAYSPYSYDDRYKTRPADRTYTNNPNIDALLPPYLAITSIFRGSYGKVLNHNKINGIDWYNYKYDKVDELKLPNFALGQLPATSTTTTTTSTTTTYIPPVKPWRFIETNQFRKKAVSPDKTVTKIIALDDNAASEKNALSYSTPPTESTTPESLTTVAAADILLTKAKNTIDSYKLPTTLSSTVNPVNITETAYKLPASTASYKSRTTTYRPSTITYGSLAGSTNNYLTSTTGYESPSFTTTVRPRFPSFAFTFPTTTARPKTVTTAAFTFPPWAFKSRALNVTTSTVKPPTTTSKPMTSRTWYTFTTRVNPFGSLTTPRYRQSTKTFLTSSSQKPSLATQKPTFFTSPRIQKPTFFTTSTTQKPTYFTTSTTQKPTFFTTSTTQKPTLFTTSTMYKSTFFTTSTTQKSPFFVTSTTYKPNFFTTSTTQKPTFFTSPTTQKPTFFTTPSTQKPTFFTSSTTLKPTLFTTSTTKIPIITTLTKQKPTERPTQRTSRTTQNIFDLYLNPTKAPQLPFYSFSRDNSKFKINIFSEGTTTISPSAKSTEERSSADKYHRY